MVRPRVLVVEDDSELRSALALILGAEGFVVTSAASAGEALALFREQDFDVLVTDLGLPDRPGHAVIEEVRRACGHACRIVVFTGSPESEMEKARDAGADVIVMKPGSPESIIAAIRGDGMADAAA